MNYNKLKYFYIVSRHLNFTKAAEELYISQSAISRHMKELEEDLGVKLFIRTNRDLILTNAGRVLYEKAEEIFSKEEEIYSAVRAADHEKTPELTIGTMGIKFAYNIPIIANDLINDIPSLKVSMQRFNWDTIYPALLRKEIDVGLRLRLGDQMEESLEHFVLDENTPSMIVHKSHHLASRSTAQLSEFADDIFLVLSRAGSSIPFTHTQNLLKRSRIKPRKIIECSSPEELMMMVNAGAGVSLMSKFALLDQFSEIRVIDVKDSDPLYLELIWLKDSHNEMIVNFIQLMKERYQ